MAEGEEKKLGPNVTWNPGEDQKKPMKMYGVTFVPGQSVNVEDAVGSSGAQEVLKKLSTNRYFKVDGGPDHEAEAEKRQQAEEEGDKAFAEAQKQESEAPQPPPDWKGPESEQLESDSGARRPTMPKSGSRSGSSSRGGSEE
jgi:hypothetical protein